MQGVDLVESFQTHIYLQHSAWIQPRRGPVKYAPSSGTSGCIGPSSQVTRTSARTTRAARGQATVERARSTVTRAEPMAKAGDDWCWYRQTLDSSFSAVSKPIFASKYSLESSRRDLHNALLCTALEPLHRFGIESQKTRKTMGGKRSWSNPGKTGQEKLIGSSNSLPSTTLARELE